MFFFFPNNPPASLFVFLGDRDRDNFDIGERRPEVKRIINHENWRKPLRFSNDISLLELETEAQITDTVRTICLPKKYQLDEAHFEKKTCFISGWGQVEHGGKSARVSNFQFDFALIPGSLSHTDMIFSSIVRSVRHFKFIAVYK